MVEAGAVILAGIALLVAVAAFRRQMESNISHSVGEPQPLFRRAKRKPIVRDDLAAWREEERERFEWEQKLRAKEMQDGR